MEILRNKQLLVPNKGGQERGTGTIVRKHKKKETNKELQGDSKDNVQDKGKTDHNDVIMENGMGNHDDKSNGKVSSEPNINLSRDELLKLLSVFEGELQARDEVISILKTECSQNTETRYGLTNQPLKALQRDAASLDMTPDTLDCVQTKDQLRKIIQHQKDSYKRLKHILMTSEDKYKRMGVELEGEKKKHQEYMTKSDDFVNLLEHDRERLKQILEREKVTHDRKERELVRKLRENKDELSRLKSLSLELVEDRQRQLQNFNEQRQLVATQQKTCEELQAKLEELESTNSSEKEHSLQLENELEEQTNKFYRENEELTSKLSAQEEKNAQLEDKITSMNKQIRKLKNVDKNFRKTDDQLFKIREKLEQEERHEDLLVEVELLRKTVEEMREAEEVYAQAQGDCRDVKSALEAELDATRLMRGEIEKLRKNAKNQKEMERCIEESNFRFDEIKSQFDAEAKKAEKMRKKLEEYEEQIAKLNEFEAALKSGEIKLKQCHQVIKELKDERDAMETKFSIESDKFSQCKDLLDDERNKVTEVTQKMIEESKKVLKLKEQVVALETKKAEETESLHQKVESLTEELETSSSKEKVSQLETTINNHRKQVVMLKTRLDQLENQNDSLQNQLSTSQEEEKKARNNLKISTDKLKKLVSLGLNEQMVLAKYEDYKQKHSDLETTNALLKEELEKLESRVSGRKEPNLNNNNILLKGVSMIHATTQTKEEMRATSPPSMRIRRSSPAPREAGRSSSVRRTSGAGLVKRETQARHKQTVTMTPQKPAGSSTPHETSGSKGSIVVRVKDPPPPVSMTITHDPVAETAPNFKIVRNPAGTPRIETSQDGKKGIQIRMTPPRKSTDKTSMSRPPPSVAGRTTMKSKVSVVPSHSRSDSKSRKSLDTSRRGSISPTRIPKFRSTPPATPTLTRTTRTK